MSHIPSIHSPVSASIASISFTELRTSSFSSEMDKEEFDGFPLDGPTGLRRTWRRTFFRVLSTFPWKLFWSSPDLSPPSMLGTPRDRGILAPRAVKAIVQQWIRRLCIAILGMPPGDVAKLRRLPVRMEGHPGQLAHMAGAL